MLRKGLTNVSLILVSDILFLWYLKDLLEFLFTIVNFTFQLRALWLSENQNKPQVQLQSDTLPETGQRVLTCFMLPQQVRSHQPGIIIIIYIFFMMDTFFLLDVSIPMHIGIYYLFFLSNFSFLRHNVFFGQCFHVHHILMYNHLS